MALAFSMQAEISTTLHDIKKVTVIRQPPFIIFMLLLLFCCSVQKLVYVECECVVILYILNRNWHHDCHGLAYQ